MSVDTFCFFCNNRLSDHELCKRCKKGYICHRDNILQEATVQGKTIYYKQNYIFCSSVLCNFSETNTQRIWL